MLRQDKQPLVLPILSCSEATAVLCNFAAITGRVQTSNLNLLSPCHEIV